MRARAAISAVNDPDDRVPRAASRGGVPYAVITWWTARLQRATALVRIDVRGRNGQHRTATVEDPAGQAHLTGLGGLFGVRRVFGGNGRQCLRGPSSLR